MRTLTVAYWILTFKAMDADKDGKLTADEFKSAALSEAKAMDVNQDGVISEEEFMMGGAPSAPQPGAPK